MLVLLAVASRAQTQPPVISLQPQSQTVLPNTTVTLRVLATGTPPLRYLWRLNGVALEDETNASLTLPGLQPRDGGSYSVGVFNDAGAVKSDPAVIVVRTTTTVAASDSFRERLTLTDAEGIVQGDSSLAGVEPGEPVVRGGGKSVWYEWIAPANGIATFSTRGSAFDTLLSVSTGADLSTLRLVTRGNDDDKFYTSSAQFNVQARQGYQIAVDGFSFAGAGGQFTLAWNLEATEAVVPVIVTNPVSQAVQPGAATAFEVVTDSPLDTYQWLLNGAMIRDATNPVHRVTRAGISDLGRYTVRVTSRSGRTVESSYADLQLNSEAGALVQDKIENMFFSEANANRPAAGFVSIGLGGTVITNDFYSQGDGQQADPTPCDSPFLGTLWLGLTATNTGVIQVNTTGSQILARLAVYKLTGGVADFNNPPALVCDLTSALAGLPCVATFNATNGTNYTVVVEGYQATGKLKLTSTMGNAPAVNVATQCVAVLAGGTLQLQMPATNWVPTPRCQWRRNNQNISDATNTVLVLNNFDASMAGSYSVVMSNFVRVTTNTIANVVEEGAFSLSYSLATNNGNVGFAISGAAGHAFVLERATSVTGPWGPLATNVTPCSSLVVTNANALFDGQRFFRAVSWP